LYNTLKDKNNLDIKRFIDVNKQKNDIYTKLLTQYKCHFK